jgi:stearoyl-CoA desaturase (delta-9 desaturase)
MKVIRMKQFHVETKDQKTGEWGMAHRIKCHYRLGYVTKAWCWPLDCREYTKLVIVEQVQSEMLALGRAMQHATFLARKRRVAGTFLIGFLFNGVMGGVGCFLLVGVGSTFVVLNSTFFINSICHLWGRQPHGTSDSSRDSWLVSLVTFGEGYHNYHHMYPTDYRNGPRWYHFDPSKWLIHGLYLLGLATSLRTSSYIEDSLARTN